MTVELFFGLIIVVIVAAIIFFNRTTKGLDVNNDGKVDVADAKAAVENTVQGVKKVAKTTTRASTRKGPGQTSAKKPAVKAKTAGRGRKA